MTPAPCGTSRSQRRKINRKNMNTMKPRKGIVDKIREAKKASEVSELLRELGGYATASVRTVRRAERIARARINELEGK